MCPRFIPVGQENRLLQEQKIPTDGFQPGNFKVNSFLERLFKSVLR